VRFPSRHEEGEMTEGHLTPEQCRVLQLLSDVEPRGITDTQWAAHRLSGELLSGLVVAGLATMAGETVRIGGRTIEVVRVRITQAGREALAATSGDL
jgi:hypothetical protein